MVNHVLTSDPLPKDLHTSIFEEQKKVTQKNCRYSLNYPNRQTLMPFPGSSMGISCVHKKGKGAAPVKRLLVFQSPLECASFYSDQVS